MKKTETQKIKVLTIAGVTGAGKDHLTDMLISTYPNYFCRAKQVTTRERRAGEVDNYDFIDNDEYDRIKDSLCAKTQIRENRYGTRTSSLSTEKINIIIVNTDGLIDFLNYKDFAVGSINGLSLGVKVSIDTAKESIDSNDIERATRNIENEQDVYDYCDITITRDIVNNKLSNLVNMIVCTL